MICQACGTENAAGRKFCDECGSALSSPCPACGASNRPGAKFCGECSTPLAVGAAPAHAAVAVAPAESARAERRLVTVLFADLVGFTALAEGRDAEAVRDLLSSYFELASDLLGRYGGTVEKFIGDAVMAVWERPSRTRTTRSAPFARRSSWSTRCRDWARTSSPELAS